VKEKRHHVQVLSQRKVPTQIALQAIGLSRSSYHYKSVVKDKKDKRKAPLDPCLEALLLSLKGYELTLGYYKLADYIKHTYADQGHWYNKKKVYRHMKALKLLQPKHIKRPKKKQKKGGVLYYSPLRSNVRWEADLTFISYGDSYLYLFTVIDTFDKEIIGHFLSFRCRCEDAIESLKEAVLCRFPNGQVPAELELVLRLDRGCQYTAKDFCDQSRSFGLKFEFCDVQAPNQKPYIESFFSNFKREEVYRNDYKNPMDVFLAWKSYVEWYNNKRPHSSLGNLSPVHFRLQNYLKVSHVEA
tara:strand:+ start:455 stop:1354 length:900 start_codon:yes stop_codon:yes gene_type:complete